MNAERHVLVDNGGVQPCVHTNDGAFAVEQMFAVLILWDSSGRWQGWLSTTDRRFTSFSTADLEDDGFRRWLTSLPDWVSDRMTSALYTPGLHLVWRRPEA
jgi:hypothetical protein